MAQRWHDVYGRLFAGRLRRQRGARADAAYRDAAAGNTAAHFFIVPFLGPTAGPYSIGTKEHIRCAYECRGHPVPLGDFANRDLFVVPGDFSWTMIYTHEDDSWGGPHFARAARLVPPTRTPAAKRRR